MKSFSSSFIPISSSCLREWRPFLSWNCQCQLLPQHKCSLHDLHLGRRSLYRGLWRTDPSVQQRPGSCLPVASPSHQYLYKYYKKCVRETKGPHFLPLASISQLKCFLGFHMFPDFFLWLNSNFSFTSTCSQDHNWSSINKTITCRS